MKYSFEPKLSELFLLLHEGSRKLFFENRHRGVGRTLWKIVSSLVARLSVANETEVYYFICQHYGRQKTKPHPN